MSGKEELWQARGVERKRFEKKHEKFGHVKYFCYICNVKQFKKGKNMVNEMKAILESEKNKQLTENGAVGYKTTGKHLVDLNFKVTSMRKGISDSDMDIFVQAMREDLEYTIKELAKL